VGLPGLILRTGHVDCAQKLLPLAQLSHPVADWVEQVRQLTEPAQIHWCDGPMPNMCACAMSWRPAVNSRP